VLLTRSETLVRRIDFSLEWILVSGVLCIRVILLGDRVNKFDGSLVGLKFESLSVHH